MRKLVVAPFLPTLGGIAIITESLMNHILKDSANVNLSEIGRNRNKVIKWYLQTMNVIVKIRYNNPKLSILETSGDISSLRDIFFLRIIRFFSKSKTVVHFHGVYPLNSRFLQKCFVGRFYINVLFKKADAVVLLSKGIEQQFQTVLNNKNSKKTVVIENFTDSFAENNCKIKQAEKFHVLFVGRLSKLKGFYDLADIIPHICATNHNIVFNICGEINNKEKSFFEEKFKDFIQAGQIIFYGPVYGEQKTEIFKQSHIFVLPSYTEIFPVSVIEAMAHSLAIITTPVGAIPEMIEDGKHGYFINPGDKEALKNRINFLAENPEIVQLMGKINYKDAKRRYCPDLAKQKWNELIEKI